MIDRRQASNVKISKLWLYPELECSACVGDCDAESGEEQLQYYCAYLRRRDRYRQWWDDDAVPIWWLVRGDDDGFGCERAPFEYGDGTYRPAHSILTYYHPPVNAKTGEPIDWYRLPVINSQFLKFAAALDWLPSPGQPFAPLRSIVSGQS